jgi:hypothetical protein
LLSPAEDLRKPQVVPRHPPVGLYTVDLDALSDKKELLVATRSLLTDIYQAFGEPEVDLILADGMLPRSRWGPQLLQAIMQAFGVGEELLAL